MQLVVGFLQPTGSEDIKLTVTRDVKSSLLGIRSVFADKLMSGRSYPLYGLILRPGWFTLSGQIRSVVVDSD